MHRYAMHSEVLPPLTGSRVLTDWTFDPVAVGALAFVAVLYLYGTIRVRRKHPARPWPLVRTASFLGGLLVVAIAVLSGIGTYDGVLFWDHMIQHLLLISVAPPLLVLGRPVILALHAARNPVHTWIKRAVRSRPVTLITAPPVVAVLYGATIVLTHLTGFMNVVLTNESVHAAEHLLYLVVGYLYFLPILGDEPIRWRPSYPAKLGLVAVTMPVDTFTGVALLMAQSEMFPAYAAQHRTWGPGLVADLNAGGAIMWVAGDGIMMIFLLAVFVQWSRVTATRPSAGLGWFERARAGAFAEHGGAAAAGRSTRHDARGDLDVDDARLDEYNAWLARLAGRTSEPPVQHPPPG